MPRRRPLRTAALALALLAGACGGSQEASPSADRAESAGRAPSTSGPAPATGAPAAAPALEFTGATVGGGRFDAATLEGRPALVWFWAPW